MTEQQRAKIEQRCKEYRIPFVEADWRRPFDLPDGWVAGWLGSTYVGVSPEGDMHS
jgi:hypothetical protein